MDSAVSPVETDFRHKRKQYYFLLTFLFVAKLIRIRRRPRIILAMMVLLTWFKTQIIHPERCLLPCEYVRFEAWPERNWRSHFRFFQCDVPRILAALRIPFIIRTPVHGYVTTGRNAFLILCKRLRYPQSWADLRNFFGESQAKLSDIFQWMLTFLLRTWSHTLYYSDHCWSNDILFQSAEAIRAKFGLESGTICGFLDGIFRRTLRPLDNQQAYYNGWLHAHGIKFQAFIIAHGILSHVYGWARGPRNDAGVYQDSGIDWILRDVHTRLGLCGFGDSAYAETPWMRRAVRGVANQPVDVQAAATILAQMRVSIEWGIGNIANLWTATMWYRIARIAWTRPHHCFLVAALLTNCHVCLYGGVVNRYFNITPPPLESYLTPPPADLPPVTVI